MARIANRNDITVMVTKSGEMLIAQGSAQDLLLARADKADWETGLYYSQIAHRAAALVDGEYMILMARSYNAKPFVRCKLGGGKVVSQGMA